MPAIDAHQHFWQYSVVEYPWIGPGMERLQRDFLPQDLQPLLAAAGLTRSIAVQARQSLAESEWLLELATREDSIHAVGGWGDLRSPDLRRQLQRFCTHPKFVGVRHVAQDEPDDQFLTRPEVVQGIAQLAEFGLTYDLLIFPRQLPAAIELVQQLPQQPFVLDHLAKPDIRQQQFQPWADQLRELAQSPHVCCKLSGMVTEADWQHWTPDQLQPCLEVVFESFGPDRLMFGSDWPVCLLAAEYEQVVHVVRDFVRQHCPEVEPRIFGATAAAFYQRRPLC